MKTLAALLCIALGACSTSNVKRDMDVSGSLPRAIGLGAFTPACVMFCFPQARFTQGDVQRDEIVEGEPFIVRSSETVTKTTGRQPKKKPVPAKKPPAPEIQLSK